MRLGVIFGIGILLALPLATPASAVELGLTLDDPPGPALFTAGTATGTINPFTGPLNANDSICLDGICDLTTQDWMVFTVTVTAGSVNDVGIGALFESSVGLGYFLQGGPVQNGSGLTDTYAGDATSVPTAPVFTFAGNAGGGLTGTSLPLFVAYANGALPSAGGPFGAGATQFMVTEFGGAGIDSPIENVTQEVNIIPEPGSGVLITWGLILFGARALRGCC